MKNKILQPAFFTCLLLIGSLTTHAQAWLQQSTFATSTPRYGSAAFNIGALGYMGLGWGISDATQTFQYFNDLWQYDPSSGAWTQLADFPGAGRTEAVAFSVGGNGYIGTGNGTNTSNDFTLGGTVLYNDFWEFDPVANSWTQKNNFGGTARSEAVAFSIGSFAYVGTGLDVNGAEQDFWQYDPSTDTWTQKSNFGGYARLGAAGFTINGLGYVGTGTNNIAFNNFTDFWQYDPTVDSWTQKADFGGAARGEATGFNIGSQGYIGLGITGYDNFYGGIIATNDFWQYDPIADAWNLQGNYAGLANFLAPEFSVGAQGYIGTGLLSQFSNVYFQYLYYVTSDFWSFTPCMGNYSPTLSVTSGSLNQCEGNLSSVALSANTNSHYLWSDGETTQSITVLPSLIGNAIYWVVNPDSNYCIRPTINSDTIAVYLTPIIFPSDTSALCPGNSVTLYAGFDAPPYSSNSYMWSDGETTYFITTSTGGIFTVTTDGGCTSAPYTVRMVTNTYQPTIIFNGKDSICDGAGVLLKANKNSHYLWSDGETTQSIFAYPYYAYSGEEYWVVNPDSNLCVFGKNSVTLVSKPAPDISPNGAVSTCNGTPVVLSAFSNCFYCTDAENFLWNTGATTSSISVETAETYNVWLNGCPDLAPAVVSYACETPYLISYDPIIKNKQVIVPITWGGCGAYGWQLEYRIKGTQKWSSVTISNSSVYDATLSNLKEGEFYEVQVRSICTNKPQTYSDYSSIGTLYVPVVKSKSELVSDGAGTEDGTDGITGLLLYPNPSTDVLHVSFETGLGNAQLQVVNVMGQLVTEVKVSSPDGVYKTDFNVASLAPGMYIIVVHTENGQMSERFIKQ